MSWKPTSSGPSPLVAADLDGDGDPDLASGSVSSEIRWWSNRGGQTALSTVETAPATLEVLTLGVALEITAFHRGRTSDGDAEVASIDLLLTDGGGTPLNSLEADNLLYGIYLFEDDDGSGDMDPELDSEVAAVESFSLVDGELTVTFEDGEDHLQMSPGSSRTLFVTFAFEADAGEQTPGQIEFEHLNPSSSVEDRDHDLPLQLEWMPNVSSGVVVPTIVSNLIFADGFESGDASAWSASAP